jgi:hypothetical protein
VEPSSLSRSQQAAVPGQDPSVEQSMEQNPIAPSKLMHALEPKSQVVWIEIPCVELYGAIGCYESVLDRKVNVETFGDFKVDAWPMRNPRGSPRAVRLFRASMR